MSAKKLLENISTVAKNALLLTEQIPQMTSSELQIAIAAHTKQQEELVTLCAQIDTEELHSNSDYNKAQKIANQVVLLNSQIRSIAQKKLMLLSEDMGSVHQGLKAITGYSTSYENFHKKSGSLLNQSG